MTVLITLSGVGSSAGPTFNLYASPDGITFTTIIEGINKTVLEAGYTATVPDGTTDIKVTSVGACTNSYVATIGVIPTTTTTTSTTANPCPNCVEGSQVVIGTQRWALCNLNVTTYSDGTPIPEAASDMDWWLAPFGAWCHVNGDPANDAIYGKLYNSRAMEGIWDSESRDDPDFRLKLAPDGYHIPNQNEWNILFDSFGTQNGVVVGNKLKEIGFCHWDANNTGANNESGFTALGAGYRVQDSPGGYFDFKASTKYWSTTPILGAFYSAFNIFSVNQAAGLYSENGNEDRAYVGCSVRLIKDVTTHSLDRSSSYCVFNFCVLNDPVTAFIAYSLDSVLVEGSYIYADELLTIPYTAGPLIDNDTYIFNVSSIGQLSIACTKGLAC